MFESRVQIEVDKKTYTFSTGNYSLKPINIREGGALSTGLSAHHEKFSYPCKVKGIFRFKRYMVTMLG